MEKATIPNGLSIARASRITRAQQLNHALRINWQSYTLVSACFKVKIVLIFRYVFNKGKDVFLGILCW